ncbi:MAG: hypothetical protein ACE5DX_00625 [Candidatus Dojkabacteria bacterium]
MGEQTKTQNHSLTCQECKNDTKLADDLKEGDVVECEFCGIEYEVTGKDGSDHLLEMIEEEK